MNYTKSERERYNQDRAITCKRLDITVNQYNWFRRKGAELRRIYEDNCNGLIESEVEYANIVDPRHAEVEDKATELGLHVYFQTDPRGATIYLSREPIPENSYNRAECIY